MNQKENMIRVVRDPNVYPTWEDFDYVYSDKYVDCDGYLYSSFEEYNYRMQLKSYYEYHTHHIKSSIVLDLVKIFYKNTKNKQRFYIADNLLFANCKTEQKIKTEQVIGGKKHTTKVKRVYNEYRVEDLKNRNKSAYSIKRYFFDDEEVNLGLKHVLKFLKTFFPNTDFDSEIQNIRMIPNQAHAMHDRWANEKYFQNRYKDENGNFIDSNVICDLVDYISIRRSMNPFELKIKDDEKKKYLLHLISQEPPENIRSDYFKSRYYGKELAAKMNLFGSMHNYHRVVKKISEHITKKNAQYLLTKDNWFEELFK